MVPQESQADEQPVFDYLVTFNVGKKDIGLSDITLKDHRFNQITLSSLVLVQDVLETSYARLITQLYGEQMFISNATGCSSV